MSTMEYTRAVTPEVDEYARSVAPAQSVMGDYLAFPASPAPLSPSPSPSLSYTHAYVYGKNSNDENNSLYPFTSSHRPTSLPPRPCRCHRPPPPRSNKIVIYPLPSDVPPNQLRDLLQSRIGPVVLVTMMMVGREDIAAEVEFWRNDGWRAYREFDGAVIDGQTTLTVLPLAPGATFHPSDWAASHRKNRNQIKLADHTISRQPWGGRRRGQKGENRGKRRALGTFASFL